MFRYRVAIYSGGSRVYLFGAQLEQDAINLAEDMLTINTSRDKAVVEKWNPAGSKLEKTVITLEASYNERVVKPVG